MVTNRKIVTPSRWSLIHRVLLLVAAYLTDGGIIGVCLVAIALLED